MNVICMPGCLGSTAELRGSRRWPCHGRAPGQASRIRPSLSVKPEGGFRACPIAHSGSRHTTARITSPSSHLRANQLVIGNMLITHTVFLTDGFDEGLDFWIESRIQAR